MIPRLRPYPLQKVTKLMLRFVTRDLVIEFDGLHIAGSVVDHLNYLQKIKTGRTEPSTMDFIKKRIQPNMVVLDIGAFIGHYTLLAARTGAKVYAFEPDPVAFKYLLRNLNLNRLNDKVESVQKAVAGKPGLVRFNLNGEATASLFYRSKFDGRSILVEAVTVDEFLPPHVVVDFIKMDIEGGEVGALDGMRRTIARGSADLQMLVECHPTMLRYAGHTVADLLGRLSDLGFSIMVMHRRTGHLAPPDVARLSGLNYGVNLLCTRK